ncbi:hypothetical protein VNO77_27154 [Canavalia gladiata]|uniref:Uncharacterized protein n=1 Tax=Canavalia gladiata TaxID=3824 RepID=A0AAN9KTI0_CANGL
MNKNLLTARFCSWFNSYLAKEPQDAALLPPKHLPSLYLLQGSCYWRTAMTDFVVEKYSESFPLLSLDLLAFIPVPLYFFCQKATSLRHLRNRFHRSKARLKNEEIFTKKCPEARESG